MKTIFIALLICLCGFNISLFGQTQATQKMLVERAKNPGAAFLSSVVVPGAGQMYNGDVGLGLGLFLSEAAIIGFAINSDRIIDFKDWKRARAVRRGCYVAGGVVYMISVIQAPLKAKQLNDERGITLKKNRKLEFYANHQDGTWIPGLTLTF